LVGWSTPLAKSAPVLVDGKTQWVGYKDIEYPIDWFEEGLAFLLSSGLARCGQVGQARGILFDARPTVHALVEWRRTHRR
jgi:aminoglycoside N3'-acetyltransferase